MEKAAALNGTPIHHIRLVHELQTLLSDDMTLFLDMGRRHPGGARAIAQARRGEEDFRSSFSPIQEVVCTARFRVSDTRRGTCVILPAFLQSRRSISRTIQSGRKSYAVSARTSLSLNALQLDFGPFSPTIGSWVVCTLPVDRGHSIVAVRTLLFPAALLT